MHFFQYNKSVKFPFPHMSVAMGNFDGLHIGHQELIKTAKSKSNNDKFGILTFDPHPSEYFFPENPPFRLMNKKTKNYELEKLGLDVSIEIPFNQDIANLEPSKFVEDLLSKYFNLKNIVVGEDFKFGHKRKGNTALLTELGNLLGISVIVVPMVKDGDNQISSTAIRAALVDGNLQSAAKMLGRWYSIVGKVIPGDKRGRTLGFPTINLELKNINLPRFGVYAAVIEVSDGTHKGKYMAAASIGARPTYGENVPNLEAHILDFSGDLYLTEVVVSLVQFQRPEEKFNSSEALVKQMNLDCKIARQTLETLD